MVDSIPDGWHVEKEIGKNGKKIECYTNVIGQKFYSMEDLLHYVKYAKEEGLSIYSHGPDPNNLCEPGFNPKAKKREIGMTSTADDSNKPIPAAAKPRKQAKREAGKQSSKTKILISDESEEESSNSDVEYLPW